MKKLCFLIAFLIISPLMAKDNLQKGIYAAALTPLNTDLSCNSKLLAAHSFDLIERGCKGVVLFGTTGEGPSFSVNERLEVLESVIAAGLDPKKVILGNGSSGISDTVELSRAALKHGCAAMLIAPSSFFKNIKDEGVIAFYREIIQRVANPELRIILYHIPQNSGVPITLRVIEELRKEFPDIVVGIKESEGNIDFSKAVIDAFPGFKVYVGNERHIIEVTRYGGSGSICGIANLYPELICSLFEQEGTNPAELEAVFTALKGYVFIPAAKALMEARNGSNWRWVRPTLIPLDLVQSKAFVTSLQELEHSPVMGQTP